MARNVGLMIGTRKWPTPLRVTCVDTFTGERCVVDRSAKVGLARAVAASSAVPGLFPPQPIGDRRCMDGGVSGSGTHLDLLAGARKAIVLSLTDGSDVTQAMMTVRVGAIEAEFDALRASGTEVFARRPPPVDVTTLMDPTAVPDAISTARQQARDDLDVVRAFLA